MELINGKGKINAKMIRELFANEADSDEVSFFDSNSDWLITTNVKDCINDIFKQTVADDKNVELNLVYGEHTLTFTGKDFNWFLKDDRLDKLKKSVYKQEKIENVIAQTQCIEREKYHVAIAYTENDDLKIDDFVGSKQECLSWFNNNIVKHANLQGDVTLVFCLDYDVAEPEWSTLQELFNAGKINVC